MALFFADLVREASWGAGDGDLPLGGALPGHRRFADAVPTGARFHYAILGVTHPDEWETGEGEIGDDGALKRTPIASSADGAAVDFPAGLKTVALTVAAAWFAARESGLDDPAALAAALDAKADLAEARFTGAVTAPALTLGAPLGLENGGTGAATASAARASLGLAIGTDSADGLLTTGAGDGRYQPLNAGLSAIGAETTAAFGRGLLTLADPAGARAAIGLGSAATRDIGTSGTRVPTLDGANSWGAAQAISGALAVSGVGDFGAALRATGQSAPTTGKGVEVAFLAGTTGRLFAYDRDTATRLTLQLDGSQILMAAGGTTRAIVSTNGLSVTGTLSVDGGAYAAGGLELGFRDLPRVTGGPERGKCHAASAGVTIAAGAAAGTVYSIYNDSGAAIAIAQGAGLTLRLHGGATTGDRTLAARGFATIWFNSANEAIAMGDVT